MSCPLKRENDLHLCRYQCLGLLDYRRALEKQRFFLENRAADRVGDIVLFLEHPPTYTLGRKGDLSHLLVSEEYLKEEGALLYKTDRGGDITFHGPGQLVGYPILNLDKLGLSVSDYIRGLEEVLIRTLDLFGVTGERLKGFPGVWVGNEKLAAIGVKINSRRITSHGFALNVNNNLDYFFHIHPCGLKDKGVTSLSRIRKLDTDVADVVTEVVRSFGRVFGFIMKEENVVDSLSA